MSYDDMDHAGWVEANIAAAKRRCPTARERRRAAEGKGWHAAPDRLSPFQARAINVLGIVGNGIYNAPISWTTVYWGHPWMLSVNWRNSLATYDFSPLTTLVFLAHLASIRVEISPNFRHLEINLHHRVPRRDGDWTSVGHPTLDAAAAAYARRFPPDHPVRLVEAKPPHAGAGEAA